MESFFDSCISTYDLFIFDFDGTLVNTEPFHYLANIYTISYFTQLEVEEVKEKFPYAKYERYAHSLDLYELKSCLKFVFEIDDFETFYHYKQDTYLSFFEDISILQNLWLPHRLSFLEKILSSQKSFLIVTNTSRKCINMFMKHFPILGKALQIYTKENFHHRKPHPECYLQVEKDYPNTKKIGFEDSLRGFHALSQVKTITPVLLSTDDYYWNTWIRKKYSHFWMLHKDTLQWIDHSPSSSSSIETMIDNYQHQISINRSRMTKAIQEISLLIQNLSPHNSVYLTGMGKSGYICKKSASTWISLSLPCIYLDLPNLPHGDFGILKQNDIILFISNSGNTEEIVYILKYLKNSFHKKVFTISIVGNEGSEMEKYSNFTYVMNPIQEADMIGMTPSVSSALFMMVLDMIAIQTRKDITKKEFQMNHPLGSLGKK